MLRILIRRLWSIFQVRLSWTLSLLLAEMSVNEVLNQGIHEDIVAELLLLAHHRRVILDDVDVLLLLQLRVTQDCLVIVNILFVVILDLPVDLALINILRLILFLY